MARLFTAIEIPISVARELEQLRGGVPGARWIDRENFHITLTFIGETETRLAREIEVALGEVDEPSFDLRLQGVGSFGRARPHALWAGVEPVAALMELQAESNRAISRLGIPLDSRKFSPHVTLARLRNSEGAALGAYLARNAMFRSQWFTVDRFVLMSSRPSKGGGPYAIESAFPLEAWPAEEWSET